MDEMTVEEFKRVIDSLLDKDWFPTIGITDGAGKRRMVVVPVDVFRSMHRSSRQVISIEDL